jgi:ornithine carbamoyltransferase
VSGPLDPKFYCPAEVVHECRVLGQVGGAGAARVVASAEEAVDGADFVYADSWMSYGVSDGEKKWRTQRLMPWQVQTS